MYSSQIKQLDVFVREFTCRVQQVTADLGTGKMERAKRLNKQNIIAADTMDTLDSATVNAFLATELIMFPNDSS